MNDEPMNYCRFLMKNLISREEFFYFLIPAAGIRTSTTLGILHFVTIFIFFIFGVRLFSFFGPPIYWDRFGSHLDPSGLLFCRPWRPWALVVPPRRLLGGPLVPPWRPPASPWLPPVPPWRPGALGAPLTSPWRPSGDPRLPFWLPFDTPWRLCLPIGFLFGSVGRPFELKT